MSEYPTLLSQIDLPQLLNRLITKGFSRLSQTEKLLPVQSSTPPLKRRVESGVLLHCNVHAAVEVER